MKLKIENRVNNRHSYLFEISRKNLVGKTKAQSQPRVQRSKDYDPMKVYLIDDDELFYNDRLIIYSQVGDYICIVGVNDFSKSYKEILKKNRKPTVNLETTIRAVQLALDNEDIYVNCDCPDFYYRYSYVATKNGYKFGTPQDIPAPERNPKDNIGAVCKHLYRILNNKRWAVRSASMVNKVLRDNPEDTKDWLDTDVIFNVGGRPSAKTGRNIDMLDFDDIDNDIESSEE